MTHPQNQSQSRSHLGPGASLEAKVEPGTEIVPKAAYRMYVSCPLMDLHLEEG